MATKTNRELKNKTTGIDILVPDYEEISGKLNNTVIYHVIVITKLFYFKKPPLKESDVVQFMVPRKFNEFEELYFKVTQRFPSVVFKSLPKKPLIMSENVIHERRQAMQAVFDIICKTPKLCSCPPLLEFLGVKSSVIKAIQSPNSEEPPSEEDSSTKAPLVRADDDEEDDSDLFLSEQEGPKQADEEFLSSATNRSNKSEKASLFDEQEDTGQRMGDTGDLFIPYDAKVDKNQSEIFNVDDESDLLNIDDDLDKILQVSKPQAQPKPKPRLKSKPELKPNLSPKPDLFEESNGEMDDLFAMTSPDKPVKPPKPSGLRPKPPTNGAKPKPKPRNKVNSKTDSDELFSEAKKSLDKKRQNVPEELETLDDIFGDLSDDSPTRPVFTGLDGDDDLFGPLSSSQSLVSENLSTDDISQYIQQNIAQEEVTLDL